MSLDADDHRVGKLTFFWPLYKGNLKRFRMNYFKSDQRVKELVLLELKTSSSAQTMQLLQGGAGGSQKRFSWFYIWPALSLHDVTQVYFISITNATQSTWNLITIHYWCLWLTGVNEIRIKSVCRLVLNCDQYRGALQD